MSGAARAQLKAFIERIERLEEEKKAIADDIKDVYGEAKAVGFDASALRAIVRLRKLSPDERAEATYLTALGMFTHVDVGEIDTALAKKRSEAGKSKGEASAPEPKLSVAPGRAGHGRGLTPEQVGAAADRAEGRSRACVVRADTITSPPVPPLAGEPRPRPSSRRMEARGAYGDATGPPRSRLP